MPPLKISVSTPSCVSSLMLHSLTVITAFVKPYVLSIQPLGSVPSSLLDFHSEILTGPTGFIQAPVLQVQSSITNQPVQLLALPTAAQIPSSLRLLCPSPSSKAPAYVISTPTDKTTATSEGSTVWMLRMRSWGEQVDELVDEEKYSEALSLLDNIEKASLPDYVGFFLSTHDRTFF